MANNFFNPAYGQRMPLYKGPINSLEGAATMPYRGGAAQPTPYANQGQNMLAPQSGGARRPPTPNFGLSEDDKDLLRQKYTQNVMGQFTDPYERDPNISGMANFQAKNILERRNFNHAYGNQIGNAMAAGTPGMGLMTNEQASAMGNQRYMPNVTVGGAYGQGPVQRDDSYLNARLGIDAQGNAVGGGETDPGMLGALRSRMPAPWMNQQAAPANNFDTSGTSPATLAARKARVDASGGRMIMLPDGRVTANPSPGIATSAPGGYGTAQPAQSRIGYGALLAGADERTVLPPEPPEIPIGMTAGVAMPPAGRNMLGPAVAGDGTGGRGGIGGGGGSGAGGSSIWSTRAAANTPEARQARAAQTLARADRFDARRAAGQPSMMDILMQNGDTETALALAQLNQQGMLGQQDLALRGELGRGEIAAKDRANILADKRIGQEGEAQRNQFALHMQTLQNQQAQFVAQNGIRSKEIDAQMKQLADATAAEREQRGQQFTVGEANAQRRHETEMETLKNAGTTAAGKTAAEVEAQKRSDYMAWRSMPENAGKTMAEFDAELGSGSGGKNILDPQLPQSAIDAGIDRNKWKALAALPMDKRKQALIGMGITDPIKQTAVLRELAGGRSDVSSYDPEGFSLWNVAATVAPPAYLAENIRRAGTWGTKDWKLPLLPVVPGMIQQGLSY